MPDWQSPPTVVRVFLDELQVLEAAPLASAELFPTHLMVAAQRVLHVDGAGVSVLSRIRVPLGASNELAAAAERLQSTLGVGPCLDAYGQSTALVADETEIAARWPFFYGQLVESTPFRAVASIPIHLDGDLRGAVDLYWRAPQIPDGHMRVDAASTVVAAVSEQLTAQPAVQHDVTNAPAQAWVQAPAARRRMEVWVAIGMLVAASDLSSSDALATLRAGAYARETTIDDLAVRLIERNLPVEQLTG